MIPAWHATTAHQAFPGSRVELFGVPDTSPTWTSPSGSLRCCATFL